MAAFAQDQISRQSLGASVTFSPNSSHILIGRAEQRRTWTAGAEYSVTLAGGHSFRLDYQASFNPVYLERDPTLVDAYGIINGARVPVSFVPGRVIAPSSGPIDLEPSGSGPPTPIYGDYSTEETPGVFISPVGFRANAFNSHKLQPTVSLDLGCILSPRTLPIDNAAKFNYVFSFGPGFEYFYRENGSFRIEYIYRHISNANSSGDNPGIDQGVFRFTLARHF